MSKYDPGTSMYFCHPFLSLSMPARQKSEGFVAKKYLHAVSSSFGTEWSFDVKKCPDA